jgi:putative redox protein
MPSTLSASATHRQAMVFDVKAGNFPLLTDYPLTPGADGVGPRPLELLLASLAACAGGSMAVLLQKMGVAFEGLEVSVEAQRRDEHPTVFTAATLKVRLRGPGIDAAKAQMALAKSEELICPVWAMLKPGLPIQSELVVEAG